MSQFFLFVKSRQVSWITGRMSTIPSGRSCRQSCSVKAAHKSAFGRQYTVWRSPKTILLLSSCYWSTSLHLITSAVIVVTVQRESFAVQNCNQNQTPKCINQNRRHVWNKSLLWIRKGFKSIFCNRFSWNSVFIRIILYRFRTKFQHLNKSSGSCCAAHFRSVFFKFTCMEKYLVHNLMKYI